MKLKSEYGNVIKIVDNPIQIARLKEMGYTEVVEEKKTEKAKRGKVNVNKEETE